LPEPENLEIASIEKYLDSSPKVLKKRKGIPVSLVHMGMETHKDWPLPRAHSAFLFPQKEVNDQLFQKLTKLFNETVYYEPSFRKVCGQYVGIARWPETLDRLEKACKKEIPSYEEMPKSLLSSFTDTETSLALSINFGQMLPSTLSYGWTLSSQGAPPTEITKAKQLLAKLPVVSFHGSASDKQLELKGVQ